MKHKIDIPGWVWVVIALLVIFVGLSFIGSVFRRVPLAFFFLWIVCPNFAWGLRSTSLDESLTSRGYANVRSVLVGIAVAISFLFFANYDYLRDRMAEKYLDGYSAHYYQDTDEYGRTYCASDASANSFSGKVILYLSQWVMIVMSIGVPTLTWKIASVSIQRNEERKKESNL